MKQRIQQQQCWDYQFYIPVLAGRTLHMSQTSSHQRRDGWPTNCTPKDAHASVFFYTSATPHARHIHARFELWGRPFCSSLLPSFFLPSFHLVLRWKEFIPHSFVITSHFSRSSGSPPVFYPAGDGCWIHVNVRCSACIYCMPLIVSLNKKPQLAHRWQQSTGSAFQFHNRDCQNLLPTLPTNFNLPGQILPPTLPKILNFFDWRGVRSSPTLTTNFNFTVTTKTERRTYPTLQKNFNLPGLRGSEPPQHKQQILNSLNRGDQNPPQN